MKKLLAKIGARLRRPKWRHGRFGAALMAGFLAFCALANVAVSALEEEYGWRRDFSFNGYATTGEETKARLDALTADVELYLLYQSGDLYEPLMQVLNRYAALCPRIVVLPTDIAKNPGVLTRFKGDYDTSLTADSVVVHCPATGRYKVLDYEDFLVSGYDIDSGTFQTEGLAYEKRLTEAIVYVTQEVVPTMGVLQGHGELTADTLVNLTDFLKSNNYESRAVNLLRGDTLDGVDLLMIADPQNDLTDAEIELIAAFAQEGGSLFVTRDYTDPLTGMDNYLSLLKSYGVVPMPGVVIASAEDAGSYYGEQVYLLPYLCQTDLTAPLIAAGSDVLLLAGACAFETPAGDDPTLAASTVLKSGPNAYVRDPSDGHTSIDRQEGDVTGEITLAIHAKRMHANGNISQLFAIGNSTAFTDEYLYQQRTDNEAFILQLMATLLPQKSVSLDIAASAAFHPALKAGGQTLGVALLVALPMLVAIAALAVLLPRRNR